MFIIAIKRDIGYEFNEYVGMFDSEASATQWAQINLSELSWTVEPVQPYKDY